MKVTLMSIGKKLQPLFTKMPFRMWVLYICCFFCSVTKAQVGKDMVTHYIVAIDNAIPNHKKELTNDSTRTRIEELLKKSGFKENDYLSIVTYKLDMENADFDRFINTPKDKGGMPIIWRNDLPPKGMLATLGNWDNICYYQHYNLLKSKDNVGSFQTGAKQFIIHNFKRFKGKNVNQTILIMITDENINGRDFTTEWVNMKTAKDADYSGFCRQEESTFQLFDKVEESFRFSLLSKGEDKLKPVIYAVEPRFIPALASICDIPARLPLHRVRGGYEMNLDLHISNSIYKIEKLEFEVNKYISETRTSTDSTVLHVKIDKKYLNPGDSVTLRAWVKFYDGFYNFTILNPHANSTYEKALTIHQILPKDNDAKILGFIPFYDFMWWWFPNDIVTAVSIWNVIYILTFIGTIYWIIRLFIRRNAIYEPANSEISMKRI